MKKHARAWAIGLLKYGIGFGLLIYILWANWEPKGTNPGISGLLRQTPNLLAFVALVGLAIVCVSMQFIRWFVLVRGLDLPFTLPSAFRLGLVGAFYNAFLPGSVGGDFFKAYLIAKDTPGRRAAAVATVIADRFVGLFGLIWFAAVFGGGFWLAGDALISENKYVKDIVVVCAVITVATVLGWVMMGFLSHGQADRFSARLTGVPKRFFAIVIWLLRRVLPRRWSDRLAKRLEGIATKAGGTLAEMWYAVWTYRLRPRVIYKAIAMTAAVHLGFVFMFHAAVRVYPAVEPASIAEHFVIAPIGYIAQAFVPAPGGLGGGEYLFGYLYTLLGRPEATGVVGRLTLRVVEWGIGLVGLYVFLRMKAHHELPEDEIEKVVIEPPKPLTVV